MSASSEFRKIFSKRNLFELYFTSVRYKGAVGIDRINTESFENNLEENIDIIYRKSRSGNYRFTKYREKLISRGHNKFPRIISLPTMRDKLTLKALFELLAKIYSPSFPILHKIINEISILYKSLKYNSFVRLDIKDFYPSINHALLIKEINKKIRKKGIIHLLRNAISQPTVESSDNKNSVKSNIGVPQGLSVSNILANIYMSPIDLKYNNCDPSYKYFRYVDDILILCNERNKSGIINQITKDINDIGLILHNESEDSSKMSSGNISDGISYLGYTFHDNIISVRKKSLIHLRESIIKLFTKCSFHFTS